MENISTAIALGRQTAPEEMPKEIIFLAMQAEDVSTFSESQTPRVRKSIPAFVSAIIEELGRL